MTSVMEYLVDTDWAIDYLHRADRTVRRLEELFTEGVGLSVISLAELYDGLAGSKNPDAEALHLFLEAVDVVPLDERSMSSLRRGEGQTARGRQPHRRHGHPDRGHGDKQQPDFAH